MEFTIGDIRLAERKKLKKDMAARMNLMRPVIDRYPAMDENDYSDRLKESIGEKRAPCAALCAPSKSRRI